MHYALPALLTPFAHIRNVDEAHPSVTACTVFTLTSGTAMHTGEVICKRPAEKWYSANSISASVVSQ